MDEKRINLDIYKDKGWQWTEGEYTVTRTAHWSAPGCHDGCAVLLYTKDNKLCKVEGDPTVPYNKGRLCMRCLDMVEAVNHPDRILHPLKRVGERGENKWEQISWDEALDLIAEKTHYFQENFGHKSVFVAVGTGRNAFWQSGVIAHSIFGTPTYGGFLSGESCYTPRITAMVLLMGAPAVADCAQLYEESFNHPEWQAPEYMVIWGNNPLKSNADGFYGHWVVDLMKQGTKLISVDPDVNWLAAHAEHHLQLRPGTDAAVALGMLNVIISEDLYNHEFVENWCYGFDELAERVEEWTPERVEEISWVPAETLRAAARAFATARCSSVQSGLALDHQTHGVAACQAIVSLSAVCGFVDVPGGNVLCTLGFSPIDLMHALDEYNVPEASQDVLGYDEYPVRSLGGGGASFDRILEALETGEPFPIKMLYALNTNTVACIAGAAGRVFDAMQKLEFVVVTDLFMTPTITAFADVVLPCAMSCERNSYRDWWAPFRSIVKCAEAGEAKGDEEIMLLLGKKLRPDVFTWDTEVEMLDHFATKRGGNVKPYTFTEIRDKVYEYEGFEYRKYEKGLLRADGEVGFNTPTGRIELYSMIFAGLGLDPLPYFAEPRESPLRTPELMEEFPFVLTTGRRAYEFFHSEHRQLKTMREFHPDPLVLINSDDAAGLGINDGDWVWIENIHGKCKMRAEVSPGMRKGVVNAEHAWWFPEKDGAAPGYFGLFESNINMLTTQGDVGPTGYGAPYKTQICKVYKVTSDNDTLERTPEETKRAHDAYMFARPENALY